METKLNKEQEEIIAKIKDGFIQKNLENSTSFNLIDIESIKNEVNDKQNWFKSIDLRNKNYLLVREQDMKEDVKMLHNDLSKLGLKAEVINNSIFIYDESKDITDVGSYDRVAINYQDYEYITLEGFGRSLRVWVGYTVVLSSRDTMFRTPKQTFLECIASDSFKNNLKKIYEAKLKN